MDCQNMKIGGICIVNLPLILSVLLETEVSSYSIFSGNCYDEKWKYYIVNRSSLIFTACEMLFLKCFFNNLSSYHYKRVTVTELRHENEQNVISSGQLRYRKFLLRKNFKQLQFTYFPLHT